MAITQGWESGNPQEPRTASADGQDYGRRGEVPSREAVESIHRHVTHDGPPFSIAWLLICVVLGLTIWAAVAIYRTPGAGISRRSRVTNSRPRPEDTLDQKAVRDAVVKALRSRPLKADRTASPPDARVRDAPPGGASGIRESRDGR